MASINGISLKGIKKFRDHEGVYIAQANVYLNGKKIGFWSQDSWGGPDLFDSCYDIVAEQAAEFAQGWDKHNEYRQFQDSPDVFMGHLLDLSEDEKTYKKYLRSGYTHVLYVTDGWHSATMAATSREQIEKAKTDPDIQSKMAKTMFKDSTIHKYVMDSLDAFQLYVDADHPVPACVDKA